jgi:hypothetical protein
MPLFDDLIEGKSLADFSLFFIGIWKAEVYKNIS